MANQLIRLTLLCLALFPLPLVAGGSLLFVYDSSNERHQQYVEQSEEMIRKALPGLEVLHHDLQSPPKQIDVAAGRRLVVTVGNAAAARGADYGWPTLNTLITRRSFEALLATDSTPRSAIYLEQPMERQIGLVQTALPAYRKLTVLISAQTPGPDPDYIKRLDKQGISLRFMVVADDKDINRIFDDVAVDGEALLLIPDPQVVNRHTVKPLVLGSYRNGVPLIGYSKALVKAGALMSVHSTLSALEEQLFQAVSGYMQNGVLPAPGPADEFEVAVNYQLARALKLILPPESELKSQLQGRMR